MSIPFKRDWQIILYYIFYIIYIINIHSKQSILYIVVVQRTIFVLTEVISTTLNCTMGGGGGVRFLAAVRGMCG